ncbi:hypothetical protein HTSR_0217 [Halodesulfurarchaeum formicicum]|uniref:DUF8149 domain-containing protein n=1 Tax=Halodesulfurarchaeum formicicum TaxID=1873524 RepID=A0A1D8S234_9EURY|nr:hypothetical protein [Halodesulfurarchaeum formicicum]AOW79419.1 hypothetical protein HTSR_0217 [Halodesulfurarchaeum formicicum]APE94672.1 hypothetical protein HSR6_0204 [Halodesulfurarchaeum formicicum]
MTDTDEDLPALTITCEACGTETSVPFDEVEATIEAHNERQHDGEPVAEIDPAVKSRLQDLLAEEMGLLD